MKKYSTITTLVASFAILLTGCSLPFLSGNSKTALEVTATPKASVFLDGNEIGQTPFYSETLKVGEYSIQLKPEVGDANPWEARIKLSPGIKTVISRELGETFDQSSGYLISLEEMSGKSDETSLLIVTTPDGALVSVDGEPKGFAPAAVDNLSPGNHIVIVTSPGFIEKSFNANVALGYKLTASVQLAKSTQIESPTPTPEADNPEATESSDKADEDQFLDSNLKEDEDDEADKKLSLDPDPPYVIIKDTPTGWLNVRKEPSTASSVEVITQVNPGEKYSFLDENNSGWYQIELDTGQVGWVSSKYAELVEE